MTLHGIADSRTGTAGLARLFVENHYTVLMPDIRAHGESGGAIATYGLLEAGDVHQWVDWLIASEHPRNIFAMGESLGAAVLLQSLAVEPRFRAVVAESPFANLKDIAEYRVARMLPVPQWLAYAAACGQDSFTRGGSMEWISVRFVLRKQSASVPRQSC